MAGELELRVAAEEDFRCAVATEPPGLVGPSRGLDAFIGVTTGECVALEEAKLEVVLVEVVFVDGGG